MARNGKTTNGKAAVDAREVWMHREARPVLRGRAITTPVADMSVAEVADAWQLLDLLKTSIDERLKTLRDVLLSAAERDGKATKKGGQQLDLNGAKIERQRRQKSEPEQEKMLALLAARGIDISDAFDEVKALVFNPSKVAYLQDTGKISTEEVDALKPVSHALRVYKADEWQGLFEQGASRKSKKRTVPQRRATR
jgi:hypothetical protein